VIRRVLHDKDAGTTVLTSLFLSSATKDEAISELSARAGELCEELSTDEIERLVHERETLVSSVVAEEIAFPHAVKPGVSDNVVVAGILNEPLDWGLPGQTVRIVFLFAGGDQGHLRTMSTVARILREEGVVARLLGSTSESDVVDLIAFHADAGSRAGRGEIGDALNHRCIEAALTLQTQTPRATLVLMGDTFSDVREFQHLFTAFRGYILSDTRQGPDTDYITWITGVRSSYWDPGMVQRELVRLFMDEAFGGDDTLIVLSGVRGSNRISSIRIVRRDEVIGERMLPHVDPAVSGRVLELAEELGREGREGKPIGALFVIGRISEIARFTHQLIVNPFLGYPEEARNILDPSLEETIKEFSKIDGAFIVEVDGTVVSAGTYLAVSPETLDHHPGEGARHASARAITAVTDSISIAVSESTGRVSVYLKGQRRL
jgi:diadenylate cyclase